MLSQRIQRDWWPALVFAANVVEPLAFVRWYPGTRYSPELLTHFLYFRNGPGGPMASELAFANAPRPLLLAFFGPLANVDLAFGCSVLAAALLAVVLYVVARRAFGPATAVVASGCLLLDPTKPYLTLTSGADLYVALLLLIAVALAQRKRTWSAATAVLACALVTPAAAICGLYVLAEPPRTWRKWACASLPLIALPCTAVVNTLMLGNPLGALRSLDAEVIASTGMSAGPANVIAFVVWQQLIRAHFASTAPVGFVGLLLWLSGDRRHRTDPLLWLPLLLVAGFALLTLAVPFRPSFHCFWPVEVWFLLLVSFGITETAQRLAGMRARWVQAVVCASFLIFLAADDFIWHRNVRRDFALPFDAAITAASASTEVLRQAGARPASVMAPLALVPYFTWQLSGGTDAAIAAEAVVLAGERTVPQWIFEMPALYAGEPAAAYAADLVRRTTYGIRYRDDNAMLLLRSDERDAGDQHSNG